MRLITKFHRISEFTLADTCNLHAAKWQFIPGILDFAAEMMTEMTWPTSLDMHLGHASGMPWYWDALVDLSSLGIAATGIVLVPTYIAISYRMPRSAWHACYWPLTMTWIATGLWMVVLCGWLSWDERPSRAVWVEWVRYPFILFLLLALVVAELAFKRQKRQRWSHNCDMRHG